MSSGGDAPRQFDLCTGASLHLEGELQYALDLLGAQGADLGDMAQGGGHFVAAVDPYGEFLRRPAQAGWAMLL